MAQPRAIDRKGVIEVLVRGSAGEITSALSEIHRQKALSLADSELVREERERAARYHAYHIALISRVMPEVETAPDSITGVDYRLARLFREGVERCSELPRVEDDFYKAVVEELNSIIRDICSRRGA
jgi:hypothetical protein